MTPSNITAQKTLCFNNSVRKRTEAPRFLCPHSSHPKKYKSLTEILQTAQHAVIIDDDDEYGDVVCEECGSGDGGSEMVLCDKCDRGFHIYCLRPIVVRVPTGPWFCSNCSRKKRVRMFPLMQTKIVDFFRIQKGAMEKCGSPKVLLKGTCFQRIPRASKSKLCCQKCLSMALRKCEFGEHGIPALHKHALWASKICEGSKQHLYVIEFY